MNPHQTFEIVCKYLKHQPAVNAAIFNTLRILKQLNKGDTYYESYLSHFAKYGSLFVDSYHVMWGIGTELQPQRILEIGCRVGTSAIQLLSPMVTHRPERVVLVDCFSDGFNSPHIVRMNLKHMNLMWPCVEIVTAKSEEFMKTEDKYDYVLIDGDHAKDAARLDLRNAVPLLDSGGILIFDDLSIDGCDLDDVWKDFCEINANEFHFAQNYNGKGIGVGVKK